MSIEQSVDNLAAKVDELIFAIDRLYGRLPGEDQAEPEQEEQEEQEEKPKTTRRKKTTAKRTTKSTPAKKTRAKKQPDVDEPTLDEVKKKVQELVTVTDRKTASDILETYGGVKKIGDLEESDYANIILACDEKLAEYTGDEEDEDEFDEDEDL